MKTFRPSLAYRNPLRDRFDDSFFAELPGDSGVYFMRDSRGRILYVGKALSLRNRLRSYRNAKPGQVGENVIELLENVRSIDWEIHESEEEAHRRELELIHALTPTYNIAACWEEDYLFLGLRLRADGAWEFRLTSEEASGSESPFEYFGCFRHRRKTKSAYLSLLRLLYAATDRRPRFSFPAKIARFSPPYAYVIRRAPDQALFKAVRAFFRGESNRLLSRLVELVLENEGIPPFMRAGIQEDFDSLRDFYAFNVRANFDEGVAGLSLSHEDLRQRIRGSLSIRKVG